MIFRLSQKLATKLKEGNLPAVPLDENPYADWSAHLFTVARTQYIIVANTRAFYSVVMYGKGITDYSEFISRALSALREFMEDDGQSFVYQRLIAPTSGSVQFAKALDRSVTGSINELVKFATVWLEDRRNLAARCWVQAQRCSCFRLLPQARKTGYGKPREAFKALTERLEPNAGDTGVTGP